MNDEEKNYPLTPFIEKLSDLKALNDLIEKRAQEIADKRKKNYRESESVKEINAALAKAQGSYPKIGGNRENSHWKNSYADLDKIMHAIRPSLERNGLSVTQQPILTDAGATILVTRVRHSSGQFIEAEVRVVPTKHDPQNFGSVLSHMKRYSVSSLLNITTSSDPDDDDAELAMEDANLRLAKGPLNKFNRKKESTELITKEQLEELEYELEEYPDIVEEILDKMRLQSLADLPKSKFLITARRVREIKSLRSGTAQK